MNSKQKVNDEIYSEVTYDAYRPLFHFTCPEVYAQPFDPNGLMYYKGHYHMFYIFQNEDGHCWGHASSKDLLHWEYYKTALSANENVVESGIFSGNGLLDKDGIPTLVYFGVDAGICIAQSTDENLDNWVRFSQNPVIPIPKKGDTYYGVYSVFDPHMWLEYDIYYMVLAGMVKPNDEYDTLYLFKSKDMINWEYLHPMYEPNKEWTKIYEDCACPDFFKLGDKHALLCISHGLGARMYIGKWENEKYYPEAHKRLNYPGGASFAPESVSDDKGRRIYFTWAIDGQYEDLGYNHYSTCMTIPRTLGLDDRGEILIKPVEELTKLRYNHRQIKNVKIDSPEIKLSEEFKGNTVEIKATINIAKAERAGLKVLCSPDSSEETGIYYDSETKELVIDYEKSTENKDVKYTSNVMRGEKRDVIQQRAELNLDDYLDLHILIDRSIIEVFANERICMTARLYPKYKESVFVKLFGEGAVLKSFDMWDIEAT